MEPFPPMLSEVLADIQHSVDNTPCTAVKRDIVAIAENLRYSRYLVPSRTGSGPDALDSGATRGGDGALKEVNVPGSPTDEQWRGCARYIKDNVATPEAVEWLDKFILTEHTHDGMQFEMTDNIGTHAKQALCWCEDCGKVRGHADHHRSRSNSRAGHEKNRAARKIREERVRHQKARARELIMQLRLFP